jgi:phospholipid-translocating ATPase
LDGETDWKLRKAIKLTQSVVHYGDNPHQLLTLGGHCKCEQPSPKIYEFKGAFTIGAVNESLSLENVIWASTVLACSPIWGLVIYSGKDTRISLNSKRPQTKIGKFDREVDNLAKLLFMIMALLTIIITICSHPVLDLKGISVACIRYLVLLSNIIPVDQLIDIDFDESEP